jgi:Zn-dependent M16 (insulinase) family peptidase
MGRSSRLERSRSLLTSVKQISLENRRVSLTHCAGLKVEQSQYQKGVQWLHELLYCSQFTAERLSIAAKKILKDISRQKRSGETMAAAVVRQLNFDYERSNIVPAFAIVPLLY